MTIDLSQFHQVFFEESIEGLDMMESSLMELDTSQVDSEVINTIFRSAHSIKGGSATFDFNAICDFTHVLETLLDQVRSGERQLAPAHIDLLLQSVDCIREMLNRAQQGELTKTQSAKELQAQFEAILSNAQTSNALDSGAAEEQTHLSVASDTDSEKTSQEKVSQENGEAISHWLVSFVPHPTLLQTGNDPLRLIQALYDIDENATVSVHTNITRLPDFENFDPELCYLSWTIDIKGQVAQDDIHTVFEWVDDEADISIESQLSSAPPSEENTCAAVETSKVATNKNESPETLQGDNPSAGKTQANEIQKTNRTPAAETTFIRVGTDKIDQLINMVGELVITQSMLSQVTDLEELAKVPRLSEGISQLEQNTRELQESVMRIRMLPISFSFNRFPRLVRDLSQKLNKKIQLNISGENTELDKTVMEKIGDPLVHLVRNAIDHGIELPKARVDAGKSETGNISLDAFHQGGHVFIQIKDDGAGLNKDKLIEKALERQLITQNQVASMADEQVFDLIFQPGFSTAAAVTDVSGRGVGMDVVKRNIQALGGSVEITSTLGQGSTITIRLPLTMAILDGQLIRIGSNIYIFPLVSIVESLQCDSEHVSALAGGQRVFRLRDEYVPIIELSKTFNITSDSNEIHGSLMVVVESQGQKIGVIVDELLAQQQVVIKSLEQNYQQVMGVSGATILGDGMVALILDVPSIVTLFTQQQVVASQAAQVRRTSLEMHQGSHTIN